MVLFDVNIWVLPQLVVHAQKLVYNLKIYIPRCVGKSGNAFSELTRGQDERGRGAGWIQGEKGGEWRGADTGHRVGHEKQGSSSSLWVCQGEQLLPTTAAKSQMWWGLLLTWGRRKLKKQERERERDHNEKSNTTNGHVIWLITTRHAENWQTDLTEQRSARVQEDTQMK